MAPQDSGNGAGELMKLRFLLWLALLLSGQYIQGGYNFGAITNPIKQNAATCGYISGGSTTVTCTLGASVTATDGLFVFEVTNGSPSTPVMTGETFNTFTGTPGCQDFTGDFGQCYLVNSAVGGQTNVTCGTTASSVSLLCIVVEIKRPSQLSTPKDAGGHTQNAGATSFSVSTSAVTTVSNDVVLSCWGSFGAAQSNPFVAAGSFTQVPNANVNLGVGNNGQAMCEYLQANSTGTQTGQATLGSSARATGIILAVKP
jgi:hypothetical protein